MKFTIEIDTETASVKDLHVLCETKFAPEDFLRYLYATQPSFLPSVASSPNCPRDMRAEIADHPDAQIRRRLARRTDDVDILRKFSFDSCEGVRLSVVKNASSSADILHNMAMTETSDETLDWLTGHGNALPDTLLHICAKNPWEGVWENAMYNPNMTLEGLGKLLEMAISNDHPCRDEIEQRIERLGLLSVLGE